MYAHFYTYYQKTNQAIDLHSFNIVTREITRQIAWVHKDSKQSSLSSNVSISAFSRSANQSSN